MIRSVKLGLVQISGPAQGQHRLGDSFAPEASVDGDGCAWRVMAYLRVQTGVGCMLAVASRFCTRDRVELYSVDLCVDTQDSVGIWNCRPGSQSTNTIMTKKEHNDRMNMKKPRRRSPPGSSSWWENIMLYDRQWTQRWGICATQESTSGRLRPVMKGLEISGHGLPWFTILLAILYQSYLSKNSVVFNPTANLVLGMLLDLLINFIVKGTVKRPRPAVNKPDMLLTISVDNFSFPSGHCTRAAFVFYFFVTTFTLPLLIQFLLLLWMLAVCISRVLLGRHYWTDVICGIIIGLLQGLVIQRNWKTWDLTEDL